MKQKALIITGGMGFIGSNFIEYIFSDLGDQDIKDKIIINLDCLTYAARKDQLRDIANKEKKYRFISGNICDAVLVNKIFSEYHIDGIIHFAAESHVDNSIENPQNFIETNVMGTFNLLNTAKNYWMEEPFEVREEFRKSRFHHISTDEVYGSLELDTNEVFTEKTSYAPNSPYSASKASSDMIVRSYYHTYGMNVVITNCSNNYGPHQNEEKLIPKIIQNAMLGKKIPIYGDGLNIRDWLYVRDHCKAIYLTFKKGISGEVYNIGSKNEMTNIEITKRICQMLNRVRPKTSGESYENLIHYVKDRPGHDKRYAIDPSKIESEIRWAATEDFDSGITKTINHYLEKMNL